jgi:hypothetical protein
MARQDKKWNKSRLLLQLPVYHSAYFYDLFLDSLNPYDPSDLIAVSRTEYFSMLQIGRLGNVGNAQFHGIQKTSHRQGRTTEERHGWTKKVSIFLF